MGSGGSNKSSGVEWLWISASRSFGFTSLEVQGLDRFEGLWVDLGVGFRTQS